MKRVFFTGIVCALSGCMFSHNHKFTLPVQDKDCPLQLYEQYYTSLKAYLATDINSVYLTDSVNFRMKIGSYDTYDESIKVSCKGDSLIVSKEKLIPLYYKVSGKDTINIKYPPQILEVNKYDIKSLIGR